MREPRPTYMYSVVLAGLVFCFTGPVGEVSRHEILTLVAWLDQRWRTGNVVSGGRSKVSGHRPQDALDRGPARGTHECAIENWPGLRSAKSLEVDEEVSIEAGLERGEVDGGGIGLVSSDARVHVLVFMSIVAKGSVFFTCIDADFIESRDGAHLSAWAERTSLAACCDKMLLQQRGL